MTESAPRRRLVLWYCLAIGSIGALHPLLSLVLLRRGASETAIPSVLALFPLGLLFAGPLWGWLADRTGRTARVVTISMSIAALGATTLLLPQGWLALVPGLALIAFARGGSISLFDVYTMASLGGGEAGRSGYGRIRMWGSVTFIVAVQGTGVLAERLPSAPLAGTAAMLAGAAVTAASLPGEPGARPAQRVRMRDALAIPSLRGVLVVAVLHVAAMSTYDHLFALHASARGLDDGAIGTAVALGVAAEVAVMYFAPTLLARFRAPTLLAGAVLAGIPRWWITATTLSPELLVATQALHGLTFGLWWVGGVAYVSEQAPAHLRGTAQGAFVAAGFGLGSLSALLVAGQALPRFGSPALFGGLTVVSAVAVLLLPWALSGARRASSGGGG